MSYADTEMKIIIGRRIALPRNTLRRSVADSLRERLTIDNPEYKRRARQDLYLGNTPKHLRIYRETRRHLWVPRGVLPSIIRQCREESIRFEIDDRRLDLPAVDFDHSIQLRDYQKPAVQKAMKWKSGVVVAPTGSGKTVIGLAIVAAAKQPALWVVHTKDLAQQARERAAEMLGVPDGEIGRIEDGECDVGERFTVGTVQTLVDQDLSELAEQFGLVLLDEAHHAPAETFTEVMTAFPARYRLGLTATPKRRDGLHPLMFYTIGYTLDEVEQEDLVEDGHIVRPDVRWVKTDFEYPDPPAGERVAWHDLMAKLIEDDDRNNLIVQTITREAHRGHTCLVLSSRVAHCEAVHDALQERLGEDDVALLTGSVSKTKREAAIEQARQGDISVLVGTQVADEGLDIPRLDRLFLTTPARDASRVRQRVGRITRPAEGKDGAIVFDFLDEEVGVLQSQAKSRYYGVYRKLGCDVTDADVEADEGGGAGGAVRHQAAR